jgi:2-methylcitrate dehydratase
MDSTTSVIAGYAVSVGDEAVSSASSEATKRHLIDAVACALGALDSRPARVARTLAGTASSSLGASVFALPGKTSPEYAAFANTVAVRYLDFNDTGIGGHPSDMIPAVLALAEPLRRSGKDVIRAIHAEYEVVAAVRRGGLYGNRLRQRHIDQVSTLLGGAVGAGIVLGLDHARMANAIALAITPNIPLRVTRTGVLSDWKGCATAHCAMMAVFAARLANEGLTGPAEPFEGLAGFHEMTGLPALDLRGIGEPRNGLTAMETTSLKYIPADYNAQGPVEALLAVRDQCRPEEIERVRIFLHWGGWHAIGGGAGDHAVKWAPETRETADHSVAFLAAVALVDGEVTAASFREERLRDPALREFMQRIEVLEDPELTAAHTGELPSWASVVEVVLTDGHCIRRRTDFPKGHASNPLTDAELEAKFWSLSERCLPQHEARQLLDTLWSLDELDDIAMLADPFRSCRVA